MEGNVFVLSGKGKYFCFMQASWVGKAVYIVGRWDLPSDVLSPGEKKHTIPRKERRFFTDWEPLVWEPWGDKTPNKKVGK